MQRKRALRCPNCGKLFAKEYARAFSCSGCPSSIMGDCGYIKCPYCGSEFPL